jgi:hypothetical protein
MKERNSNFKFCPLKGNPLSNTKKFEIVFQWSLLIDSKVLNPCEKFNQLKQNKSKKIPPKFDKNLGMLQTTTLKRNLVPEIGEASKKIRFWVT